MLWVLGGRQRSYVLASNSIQCTTALLSFQMGTATICRTLFWPGKTKRLPNDHALFLNHLIASIFNRELSHDSYGVKMSIQVIEIWSSSYGPPIWNTFQWRFSGSKPRELLPTGHQEENIQKL